MADDREKVAELAALLGITPRSVRAMLKKTMMACPTCGAMVGRPEIKANQCAACRGAATPDQEADASESERQDDGKDYN